VLKSVYHPLALKLSIIHKALLLVFGIQCLPSVKVSPSLGAFAFHQATSLVCFIDYQVNSLVLKEYVPKGVSLVMLTSPTKWLNIVLDIKNI
jgi:hypothetical protein